MNTKKPPNAKGKYGNVKSALDTGSSMTKYLAKVAEENYCKIVNKF
jgi:hypothetical protein